jgi:hypothetical protein
MGLEESKLGPTPPAVEALYVHYHTLNAEEKW